MNAKQTIGARVQSFLRGVGSVIDLQPNTRQNRPPEKMVFSRTVFINGRKIELGGKRNLFEETVKAYQSDWKKITGDVEKVIGRLPAATREHANRRLAAGR